MMLQCAGIVLVSLAFGACRSAPEAGEAPPADRVLTELDVRIDAHDTSHEMPIDANGVGERMTDALADRAGWTTMNDGTPVTGDLDVVVYDIPRSADLGVVLSVRLVETEGGDRFDTEVRDRLPAAEWDADPGAALDAAIDQLTRQVEWLGGIARADAPTIRDALTRAEGDVFAAALAAAEEADDPAAVAVLVERLPGLTPTDYVRAVGTLAQLGDDEALSPIIDALDLEDPETVLAVLPAIARFDGAETAGFITALASGHSDPRVRLHATRALERVRP